MVKMLKLGSEPMGACQAVLCAVYILEIFHKKKFCFQFCGK